MNQPASSRHRSPPTLVGPGRINKSPIQVDQPGYYPGFSTLAQKGFWDEATRSTILNRILNVPPIRFFSPEDAHLMELIASHLIPQDDRSPARRIPIVPYIDERLFSGRTPGYQFAKMPPDGEAYVLGLRAIKNMSQQCHRQPFTSLSWREQELLLKSIYDAKPMAGAADIWSKMPVNRFWHLIIQDCIEAYYSHPWSWDEIGFGGPAYPRGYMRLDNGEPEPWEVSEQRYEWTAPDDCLSDTREPAIEEANSQTGQEGTH